MRWGGSGLFWVGALIILRRRRCIVLMFCNVEILLILDHMNKDPKPGCCSR